MERLPHPSLPALAHSGKMGLRGERQEIRPGAALQGVAGDGGRCAGVSSVTDPSARQRFRLRLTRICFIQIDLN